ncbi:MAG: polysaccharide deacetylase family protein [Syntrophobacterales bacterium]|jgi:peptidoglycan/xylan/chitin deacetylase (PgdA/CDA1 family)|nr:polysaccharide deacetylase family protein [Syntrophobacterales bacterium]
MDKAWHKTIGVKVDVDTDVGMKNGVPVLLELFRKYGIHASFFVPMGKDHTGRTAKRVFTKKGFLKKAGRVGVLSTYGVKTLMYGLVLPGPEIARENGPVLRRITGEGHEAGIHGLDHVYWHDHIKSLGKARTVKDLEKAFTVYREVLGNPPVSFAAPGWMINGHALNWFEEKGFIYSSDTRGSYPFRPILGGEKFKVLQIPSSLPTLDEMVGIAGTDQKALADHFFSRLTDGLNILTVHTELEGKRWTGFLESFVVEALRDSFTFVRLIDIAARYEKGENTPSCEIVYGHVEGRAGEVSLQKTS